MSGAWTTYGSRSRFPRAFCLPRLQSRWALFFPPWAWDERKRERSRVAAGRPRARQRNPRCSPASRTHVFFFCSIQKTAALRFLPLDFQSYPNSRARKSHPPFGMEMQNPACSAVTGHGCARAHWGLQRSKTLKPFPIPMCICSLCKEAPFSCPPPPPPPSSVAAWSNKTQQHAKELRSTTIRALFKAFGVEIRKNTLQTQMKTKGKKPAVVKAHFEKRI